MKKTKNKLKNNIAINKQNFPLDKNGDIVKLGDKVIFYNNLEFPISQNFLREWDIVIVKKIISRYEYFNDFIPVTTFTCTLWHKQLGIQSDCDGNSIEYPFRCLELYKK